MKSKTSLFNKTLFKKNVTRFWPIWVIYTGFLLVWIPFRMMTGVMMIPDTYYSATELEFRKLETILNVISGGVSPFVPFVYGIVAAIAVFSYLFTARNCNMIHALPVNRKELFVTNYISGLSFLVLPGILAFALSMIIAGVTNASVVGYVALAMVLVILEEIFFFSCGVFCCFLTGNMVAAGVYYAVCNFAYYCARCVFCFIVAQYGYGMSSIYSMIFDVTADEFLSPLLYMGNAVGIDYTYNSEYTAIESIKVLGLTTLLLYLLVAVLLVVISYVLYQRRQLECAGDVLAVRFLHPAFRWLIAFFGGVGFAFLIASLFGGTKGEFLVFIIFAAVLIAFAFFIAQMILAKSFRVFGKKKMLECAACVAVSALILIGIRMDIMGFEKKVPDSQLVEAVSVAENANLVTDDPNEIAALEEVQQLAINHKNEYRDYMYSRGDAETYTLNYTYYLTDGSTLMRSYDLPLTEEYLNDKDQAIGRYNELMKESDMYARAVLCENYDEVKATGGTIEHAYVDGTGEGKVKTTTLTGGEAQILYDAVKEDLLAGNMPYGPGAQIAGNTNIYYDNLTLNLTADEIDYMYEVLPEEVAYSDGVSWLSDSVVDETNGVTTAECYIYISDTCKNTIDALVELGLIKDADDLIYDTEFYEMTE